MTAPLLSAQFPILKPYTVSELSELSSDKLTELLIGITKAGESLNTQIIQLQTQAENLEQRKTEIEAQLQQEFGVSTIEELEQLRQRALSELERAFASFNREPGL